ncbi:hypothetical protein BDQ12DRAFT_618727 [Crucibulum laeve]|uniref:DUF7587 domain-containing protein n=1 Tax=Crucibulum laeve TaxID=68775 RepID=A0A5C3LEI5_9AGAR|nr:hypothetical protein BDQ12DRAFT_618727 [Crucibulum laeve]
MSSNSNPYDRGLISVLPQYGFGADVDFDSLAKSNRFIFRVYTPKERSPFLDESNPYFLAPKFDEKYNSPVDEHSNTSYTRSHVGTYADVARHLNWTTRSSSVYISTSFSCVWSIWEALRRYHTGVKKDIEIAVIDTEKLSSKAVTAIYLLQQATTTDRRRREFWKWYRFAQESQTVLVHAAIPTTAVISSVPLLHILEKMPRYFLLPDSPMTGSSPLSRVRWDYKEKKPSYRLFCQEMSNSFFNLSPALRLRETSTGSIRLALELLRPWFYCTINNDAERATGTLSIIALTIARWPGQWWAQDHSELWDLVHSMAIALGEELREKDECLLEEEVARLNYVISRLEGAVSDYEIPLKMTSEEISSATSSTSSRPLPLPIEMEAIADTPPKMEEHLLPVVERMVISLPPLLAPPSLPVALSPPMELSTFYSSLPSNEENTDIASASITQPEKPTLMTQSEVKLICNSEPSYPPSSSSPKSADIMQSPALEPHAQEAEEESGIRVPTVAEAASCLVTGFLVGAFITLCLLSPHRRALLYVT